MPYVSKYILRFCLQLHKWNKFSLRIDKMSQHLYVAPWWISSNMVQRRKHSRSKATQKWGWRGVWEGRKVAFRRVNCNRKSYLHFSHYHFGQKFVFIFMKNYLLPSALFYCKYSRLELFKKSIQPTLLPPFMPCVTNELFALFVRNIRHSTTFEG